MIRRTETPYIPGLSEAAVKLRALRQAYGTDRPFLPFYQGDDGSVCALLDGVCVWLPGAAPEEMALFLTMQPDVRAVRTTGETARRLSKSWGVPADSGAVMTPARRFEPPMDGKDSGISGEIPAAETEVPDKADALSGETGAVCREAADSLVTPQPRELYPLLRACFGDALPPFESWYVDVSHRFRHGWCRTAGIRTGGALAACAMTTAECGPEPAAAENFPGNRGTSCEGINPYNGGAALLGAVATQPEYRGRGYASRCLSALTAALQAEGRHVLLSPKNEYAQALYERLGFMVCGEWGEIHRK